MAQPFFNVGVAPANPTAADQLVATLGQFGRIFLTGRGSVTNLGSSIEVVFYESNCSINAGVPSESTLPLGRLKAGSYQVRIFTQGACLADGIITASGPISPIQTVALTVGPVGLVSLTDLWWDPLESGWGMAIVQSPANRQLFAAWYTYEADRRNTWFVMTGGSWTDANTFAGDLYRTTGPGFATPFIPSQVVTTKVGKLTIYFTDANNGTFYYTIDGASGAKNITRQIF